MSHAGGLELEPLGRIGVQIKGVDLAHASDAQVAAIKAAWYRHDVLLFREQRLTDDDLLRFSRHFGALDMPPNQGAGRKSPRGYPEVYIVSNVRDDQGEPARGLRGPDGLAAARRVQRQAGPHQPQARWAVHGVRPVPQRGQPRTGP